MDRFHTKFQLITLIKTKYFTHRHTILPTVNFWKALRDEKKMLLSKRLCLLVDPKMLRVECSPEAACIYVILMGNISVVRLHLMTFNAYHFNFYDLIFK